MEHLNLSLFGPFRVAVGDRAVTDFHSDKVRALLAYLALEPDRPHRRESLAGLLWPDYPELSARQSLSQALYDLRAQIGEVRAPIEAAAGDAVRIPLLTITRSVVQLNSAACASDVATFEALLEACLGHGHPTGEGCAACTD